MQRQPAEASTIVRNDNGLTYVYPSSCLSSECMLSPMKIPDAFNWTDQYQGGLLVLQVAAIPQAWPVEIAARVSFV
jgi:hypothetical protein